MSFQNCSNGALYKFQLCYPQENQLCGMNDKFSMN